MNEWYAVEGTLRESKAFGKALEKMLQQTLTIDVLYGQAVVRGNAGVVLIKREPIDEGRPANIILLELSIMMRRLLLHLNLAWMWIRNKL
jgi:hypothetical protein